MAVTEVQEKYPGKEGIRDVLSYHIEIHGGEAGGGRGGLQIKCRGRGEGVIKDFRVLRLGKGKCH